MTNPTHSNPQTDYQQRRVEALAAIEHDQWIHWSKAVAHEVSPERKARWEMLWIPYEQLDEHLKDSDRSWAEAALAAADAIDDVRGVPGPVDSSVSSKREETAEYHNKAELGTSPTSLDLAALDDAIDCADEAILSDNYYTGIHGGCLQTITTAAKLYRAGVVS